MYKEIEEARALMDGMDRAITEHGIAKAAEMFPQEETGLAAFTLLRNLLALFDRMQQEPGILFTEHFIDGKWVPENGTMNPQMGGDKKRIVRYRRELEELKDAK